MLAEKVTATNRVNKFPIPITFCKEAAKVVIIATKINLKLITELTEADLSGNNSSK